MLIETRYDVAQKVLIYNRSKEYVIKKIKIIICSRRHIQIWYYARPASGIQKEILITEQEICHARTTLP